MTMLIKPLAVVAAGTVLTTIAFAQSARDIRGASPYIATVREPAPKLLVDPPLPEGLPLGVFWAQYRVENLHIAPVFGAGALNVSPRVGHLHVQVDDLWWWADASDSNTIDIANLAPGEHKVRIVLVDAAYNTSEQRVGAVKSDSLDFDSDFAIVHPRNSPSILPKSISASRV